MIIKPKIIFSFIAAIAVLTGLVFVYNANFKQNNKIGLIPSVAAAGWFTSGICSGIDVYDADLGMYQWKTSMTNCDTPQCGLNGAQNGDNLVDPTLNPGVDFSAYPAQNACKAVGGRLATKDELNCLYQNRSSYGSFSNFLYWSSPEAEEKIAWSQSFLTGAQSSAVSKNQSILVRCVRSANTNVLGYAWSENIGWISFNSVNCDANNDGKSEGAVGCPAAGTNMVAYGVNLNTDNTLSGYAWSENIGWISFNPAAVAGCPRGTCQPRYDSGTGEFLGWARALANGGGWDGWVSLNYKNCDTDGNSFIDVVCGGNNTTTAIANYKASKSGSDFTGWAYGSDVVGWVSYNSKNCDTNSDGKSEGGSGCPPAGTLMAAYKVYLANNPPTVTNLSVTPPTVTALCTSGAAYGFQWTFSDSGDTESKFQIQIDNDSNFLTPTVNRTFSGLTNADGSVNTQSVLLTSAVDAPDADKLSYNTTYYWHVQVWDFNGAFSGWIAPAAPLFTTPVHMYPTADFICSPSTTSCPVNHSQFEPISFTDKSICYDNNNNSTPCASRSWSFGDGSPLSSVPNPKHTYTAQGNFALGFTMTDPGGFTCTKNSSINIGVASPKWKEVIPK